MSGPPSDMTPTDLWTALHAQPTPSEVVDFPGKVNGRSFRVRILVLTEAERKSTATVAREAAWSKIEPAERARMKATDLRDDVMLEALYADAMANEQLAMAVVSVDPISGQGTPRPTYARHFVDGGALASALTPAQKSILWDQFLVVQEKFSPNLAIMTRAEENDWLRVLAEGGRSDPLVRLSTWELHELTRSLATRLYIASSTLASLLTESPQLSGSMPDSLARDVTSVTWLPVVTEGSSLDMPDGHVIPDPPEQDLDASPEVAERVVKRLNRG